MATHSSILAWEIPWTVEDTLELHLQNSIARITSDFSSDKERSSVCLQDKLTDLQVLKILLEEFYLLLENTATMGCHWWPSG